MSDEPNLATFRLAINLDRPVRIICGCDKQVAYATFDSFNRAVKQNRTPFACTTSRTEWGTILDTDSFTLDCPQCAATGGHATIENCNTAGETIVLSPVPLKHEGAFGTGSPAYADGGASCPVCETPLTDSDLHADHHAPEIGYEYYECPDCERQFHPERIRDGEPTNEDTNTVETVDAIVEGLSPELKATYDIISDLMDSNEPASREDVIDELVVDQNVTLDTAEQYITDLLMEGCCYEPDDDKLAAI